MLMVIYSQKVTLSGMEPEVATPGDCIMPEKFDKTQDTAAQQPAQQSAKPPATPSGN